MEVSTHNSLAICAFEDMNGTSFSRKVLYVKDKRTQRERAHPKGHDHNYRVPPPC